MSAVAEREVKVVLPTFHLGQVAAYRLLQKNKFVAGRCGRRWGKTDLGKVLACDAIIKGKNIGWFAPDYRIMSEAYNEIIDIIEPVKKSSSKTEGVIRSINGGRIDFWTLENDRAGRSRKYHLVIIDEAAFGKANVMDIWEKSIKPTLLDYDGRCIAFSNTNGIASDNFLWQICNEEKYGFKEFHAPTSQNPYVPTKGPGESDADYLVRRANSFLKIKADNHPLVYQQEYLAEFVDWSGAAFFSLDSLLVDKQPVDYPRICDGVLAVIDTAVKTGSANDGTGVSYWAVSSIIGYKLVCLDWDLIQIEGALLEVWIPNVFRRLEELARQCNARMGSLGAMIEDAQSGSILLQQCANKGLPATALPSALTMAGKDARAISVSGYVYQGLVKISKYAFDKVSVFKGTSRNHFTSQVAGFKIGDKDAATRADDLLDTFTYAVAMTLGNGEGF